MTAQMTPEQTIAIIGALTAMLGVLGKIAWNSARKEDGHGGEEPKAMPREELERILSENSGLIRALHQEMRIELRDSRDKLVQMDAKIDALLRRKE